MGTNRTYSLRFTIASLVVVLLVATVAGVLGMAVARGEFEGLN